MKTLIAFVLVSILSACGGTQPALTASSGANTATSPSVNADVMAFAVMLNDIRAGAGAGEVMPNAQLEVAAVRHASDMLENGFFSHSGSDGSSVSARATAAGYSWTRIAENIAKRQRTQADVLESWTQSAGHHANNINPVYTDFSLAQVGSGVDTYWVLVLGRR